MLFKYVQFIFLLYASTLFGQGYNVLDYGAKGDGIHKDTQAVQKAIDLATTNGGGKVIIPSGKKIVVGTIFLKNNVSLYLENGAVLLGSPDIEDYAKNTHKNMYKNEPHMDRCLIFAKEAHSIAIEGYGTIDGNGFPKNFKRETGRPMLIRFLNCTDIHINNVKLINPAAWTSAFLYCNNISVSGISIKSRANYNGDGLDFDGCQNVSVTNSFFDTSDDSICLQASLPNVPCKNVSISNCVFESKWAGIRIGLLSRGNFEAVTVSNCTFKNIDDSGLKIQMNEGGKMENMTFSNLVMKNVPRPIFMTLAQQKACVDAPEKMYPVGNIQNFTFENIIVDNKDLDQNSAIFITGITNHYIKNILLRNIQLHFSGGGTLEDAKKKKLKEYTLDVLKGWWPEFHLVGTLPAYGIYARHVKGLYMDNVHMHTEKLDKRAPIILDDVLQDHINNTFSNYKLITKSELIRL